MKRLNLSAIFHMCDTVGLHKDKHMRIREHLNSHICTSMYQTFLFCINMSAMGS